MSDQEGSLKLETRLAAIEYLLCRINLVLVKSTKLSNEEINAALDRFAVEAGQQTFSGVHPVVSDHLAGEWQEAIERLVRMQKEILAGGWPGAAA